MFDFLLSNWLIFLIVFILISLILIGYLIDRDNAKKDRIFKQKEDNITNKNYEVEKSKDSNFADSVSLTDEYIASNQDKFNCFYDDLFKDESNELDLEFNKVVSKQNLLDEKLKKSIENIKIDPIESSVKYQYVTSNIILPEIKK